MRKFTTEEFKKAMANQRWNSTTKKWEDINPPDLKEVFNLNSMQEEFFGLKDDPNFKMKFKNTILKSKPKVPKTDYEVAQALANMANLNKNHVVSNEVHKDVEDFLHTLAKAKPTTYTKTQEAWNGFEDNIDPTGYVPKNRYDPIKDILNNGMNFCPHKDDHFLYFRGQYNGYMNHLKDTNDPILKEIMPQPIITLVELGHDMPDVWKNNIKIIQLGKNQSKPISLKKHALWLLARHVSESGLVTNPNPMQLYEFPSSVIQSKTDFVLFLDPYVPSGDEIFEDVYHNHGVLLVKKFNIDNAKLILATRKQLFMSAPTATNTILLFQLTDAIILNEFKSGTLDLDAERERTLLKLEKLKNLALSSKYNGERLNAVDKCFIQFDKLMLPKETK